MVSARKPFLNMDDKDLLLNSPDYFNCKKTHCRMSLKACLKRQEENERAAGKHRQIEYLICLKCRQGIDNKLNNIDGGDMASGTPTCGEGKKQVNCGLYNICLNHAARQEWEAFNCESCHNFKPDRETVLPIGDNDSEPPRPSATVNKESQKNTRICETCNDRKTISPNSPYCPRCLSKRGAALRNERQKAAEADQKTQAGVSPLSAAKSSKTSDTALTVEFGKYTQVLKEIELLADEEMRPVEMQVIFMLKKYLNNEAKEGAMP